MTQYISYLRVSTRHQGHDGNGMNAQRDAVARFVAGQKGLLLREYSEVESGGRCDRPELNAALDECRRTRSTLDRILGTGPAAILRSGRNPRRMDAPERLGLRLRRPPPPETA